MSLGCSGIGCGSLAEQQAFGAAYSKGVLSVAAAGNFGNAVLSYPASYDSVISVAAVDQNEEIAYFSQYNSQVELAAPGVAVNSTVPCYIEGTKTNGVIKVTASPIINAARGIGSGSLVNCGLGDGKTKCSPSGKICLVKNGKVSLYQKVLFCENKGAVATIVYNDVNGILTGTLAPNSSRYPVVGISNVDGATLVASWLGQTVKVVVVERSTKYTSWSGTSMATPHVSGVAALLWSNYPSVSNAEIRNALRVTAKDKGDVGRDDMYGYGIIQAQAAMSFLGSCAKLNDSCESSSNCCSGNCADAVCSS
jgi:subtilisin family serine protease